MSPGGRVLTGAGADPMVTDFGRDLAQVGEKLAVAAGERGAGDPDPTTTVVHLQLRRAALTGRSEDYDAASLAVERAFADLGPWPDLCLLRADLDVRFHRLTDARRALARSPGAQGCTQGRAILADVLLQEGEHDEAEALVTGLVAQERTWDHLARLAHLTACRGDLARADGLLVEAEEEITAKSMRSFAWVEIERGRLRVLDGDPARARAHYATAERAYSGHWVVDERLGELCALEGRPLEAIEHLERVLERTARPEVDQALGPLRARIGEPDRARWHRRRALAAFLGSAEAGEVHYLHHLVETYLDRPEGPADTAAAVHWARRDLELRPNHLTRSALARALHRDGRAGEAVAEMNRALATGLRDARLLARAAEIFGSRDEATWPAVV